MKRKMVGGKRTKVALGLSGGVDSAVSAYLLKQHGFDVHCIYMNCYDADIPGCRAKQDRKDALAVALHLGLPFQVLDFRKEYQAAVIDYFKKEYVAGRTPNPDVVCNREIKFGLLLDWCIKNGFEYLSTGHYAKLRSAAFSRKTRTTAKNAKKSSRRSRNFVMFASSKDNMQDQREENSDAVSLLQPRDVHKDQTYFLWAVPREKFEHVLFPLGDLTKDEVRAIARKEKIPVAEKKDSTGICFVGEVRVEDFLKRLGVKEKEGEVVIRSVISSPFSVISSRSVGFQSTGLKPTNRKQTNQNPTTDNRKPITEYQVIGRHRGVWFYTIGQRHGFEVTAWPARHPERRGFEESKDPASKTSDINIASLDSSTRRLARNDVGMADKPPLYVIEKDVRNNRLVVGFGAETYRDNFEVSDCNWLAPEKVGPFDSKRSDLHTMDCLVRIRHLGDLIPCSVIGFPFSVVGNKSAGFQSAGSEQNNRKLTNQELKTENRELITVFLATPARGIAAGQSAVFYDQTGLVLGGGIIQ